jgi:hypothetical protein
MTVIGKEPIKVWKTEAAAEAIAAALAANEDNDWDYVVAHHCEDADCPGFVIAVFDEDGEHVDYWRY